MTMSVFLLLYFASLTLIPVIITKKKKPVTAVAWLMALIFVPIFGGLLFLIFGTERIVNTGRKKLFANVTLRKHLRELEQDWPPADFEHVGKKLPAALGNIRNVCRKFSLFDAVGYNKVDFLIDADDTYEKMIAAIREAEDHVNMVFYLVYPDEIGARFRDLLAAKVKEGVKVNFLYDAIGSWELGWNQAFLSKFREGGIEPQEFLPLRTFLKPWNMNLRNHRKILVVDNKIGFMGSLNIGDKFLNARKPKKYGWRETDVRIQGPAVMHLQWIFCEDWFFATGEELLRRHYFTPAEACGNDIVQVVASGPDEREEAIHKATLTAITQAQRYVYVTSPYFVPDQTLNSALEMAALRGVDVRILVPYKSDHNFVKLAGRSYYERLLQNGVGIFEYKPGYLHAKMLIVDGHFTVIGSANMDGRSLSYNFEVNVQIFGKRIAKQAEMIFLKDLEQSRELHLSQYSKRPAYVRFTENVCRLFSPVL